MIASISRQLPPNKAMRLAHTINTPCVSAGSSVRYGYIKTAVRGFSNSGNARGGKGNSKNVRRGRRESHQNTSKYVTDRNSLSALPGCYGSNLKTIDEVDPRDMALEDSLNQSPSSMDLRGMRVKAKAAVSDFQALYDYGWKETFRSRSPLHIPSRGSSAKLLKGISKQIDKYGKHSKAEIQQVAKILRAAEAKEKDIPLRLKQSQLELSMGQLIPQFEESVDEEMSTEDLSEAMLKDAFVRQVPIRGRVLNLVNGGFAVSVGTRVGFMPLSHAAPSAVRGLSKNVQDIILGRDLWLFILSVDGLNLEEFNSGAPKKTHSKADQNQLNFVASHRRVPAPVFLLTEFRNALKQKPTRGGYQKADRKRRKPNMLL